MHLFIINFQVLILISHLSNGLSTINDSVTSTSIQSIISSDSPHSNVTEVSTSSTKPSSRRLVIAKPSKNSQNQTGLLLNLNLPDWKSIINVNFGDVNSTSDSVLVTDRGFKVLINSLGLKKRSSRVKYILGNATTIKCFTANEMLRWYNKGVGNGLTMEQFKDVCPVLLTQIHYRVCRHVEETKTNTKNYVAIWLYSSGAVIVCSLVGFLIVWLIPILPKPYYNSISQLLIALAVGSLTGDALLHLIPHALLDDGSGGHSHGKDSDKTHSQMVWKSLAAFVGIHIFFLTERITILCQNLKSKRKSKNKQHSHDNAYPEAPSGDTNEDPDKIGAHIPPNQPSITGKLQWASKSRKYSSSSRELEHASSHNGLNSEAKFGSHLCNRPKNKPHVNSDCPDSMNIELCDNINSFSMTEENAMIQRSGNNVDNKGFLNGEIRASNNQLTVDANTSPASINNNQNDCTEYNKDENKSVSHPRYDSNSNNVETKSMIPRSETKIEIGAGGATVTSSLAHPYHNKPHGHHHGHSHDLSSVKAIAYTVIAGDGLHNFCDGIAIGSAFAYDIRGGLSTAIAVLCHELPHELGDFVVLLHAGMSFRTAIFYNLLSSVFCAAGMIIGVLLGAIPSVSSWIFMLTAGMFLYIALVDMMPELSTRRLQGNKWVHRPSNLFLCQNIGLVLGAVIMLLIALYEEKMF